MNSDDDMDKPVTRRELREELANSPTRKGLEAWGGALNAKIDAVRNDLQADLARHANAIIEATRDIVKAALDPHHGVPERIATLEAQRLPERVAALEAARPAPRRQRRRS